MKELVVISGKGGTGKTSLMAAFASLAERKNITLKFRCDLNSIEMYIDQDKFEKIISNLLSNAFKFTPEGGKIQVVAARSISDQMKMESTATDLIQITVTNTGAGIPAGRSGSLPG